MSRTSGRDHRSWWCEHAWLGGDDVRAGVLVTARGGRITEVLDDVPCPVEASVLRGLVVPGLANAHSHLFHRLLRSHTQRGHGSFWSWRDVMYAVAQRISPDQYIELAAAVYAEMALAGITVVGEFHYLHHDVGGSRYVEPNVMGVAVAEGSARAGIRLTMLDTCYLSSAVDGSPLNDQQRRFGDGSGEAWAERVESLAATLAHRPDVLVAAAVHSVRGVPTGHLGPVVRWAEAAGAPLHVHSSEQIAEVEQCLAVHGCTPTALLRDFGVLGPRTTAVHATHVTAADVADLHASGTGVCWCPTTERDLGDGIGPASDLLADPGCTFSLGSDSHAVIDLFEEARAVELHERLRLERRGIIPAARMLTSATADGHRALGWTDAGSLRPGQLADLVAIDLGSVRTAGGGPRVETAVFAAGAADVTDVVIAGRQVVADRRHLTVPDSAARLEALTSELLGTDVRSSGRAVTPTGRSSASSR
ncbi:formimidoylglutamate deiminase [Nakamurella leprariae]|uniref:Formimidoylglutamate deiminase n=1 Tax=Nakamurella leprariae TaxID=2803911 RepID=A0A939C1U0_9ACTN|nr:formimidoylglutamate deiminase [Nakamurella leprariae]